MISRFIAPQKVLTCICAKNDAAYAVLQENLRRLQDFRLPSSISLDITSADTDATDRNRSKEHRRRKLEIETLPLPPQLYHAGYALPRSYANFYIANDIVLVPVYQEATDEIALRKIQNCFPRHHIVAIDASLLILEGGGIHCMTMQIPAFA